MWLPNKSFDLFRISHETMTTQREELATLKAERDSLMRQLASAQIISDWFRLQINTLQMEKTALLEKAYGVKLPTPELVKVPVIGQDTAQEEFSFDDVGETLAKKFGLPLYDKQ